MLCSVFNYYCLHFDSVFIHIYVDCLTENIKETSMFLCLYVLIFGIEIRSTLSFTLKKSMSSTQPLDPL